MADLKISQLTDGGDAQATDEYVVARSGGNNRIDGASVAAAATKVGTITTGTWQGSQIADTYLATISTAGKVSNSATTATNANTANAIVSRDASGNFSAGTITAGLTGNASTATTLQTARNINGVSFNGSADIAVTAAASTLTGTTLASGVTASSLTSVGTLTALAVSSTASDQVVVTEVDAGATRGPDVVLYRDSASPAANDETGHILFRGKDSVGNVQDYSSILGIITSPTSTTETSAIAFETTVAGTKAERMRIASTGDLVVGATTATLTSSVNGFAASTAGEVKMYRSGNIPLIVNRNTDDGTLVSFRQANTQEGEISVTNNTVSYLGGNLARWSQSVDGTRIDGLLKGTVLSNLDQMCVWIDPETGEPQPNEQLNCLKVSDVEGDPNVAGVFLAWDNDDETFTSDMKISMTGDMIIRIAQGTTVQRGDLLMSAGDGTAKPQGDDIVRGKTIAKVTSTHVTCTYPDGSYCVPCVLMAC